MKIYFSHAMRGKPNFSLNTPKHDENCEVAIRIADQLRKIFSKLRIYVPAESEPFVGAAYKKRYLDIKQILELDCLIVDQCDAVIVYVPEGDELQGGRKVEYDHAIATDKPVCIFHTLEEAANYIEAQYRREQL